MVGFLPPVFLAMLTLSPDLNLQPPTTKKHRHKALQARKWHRFNVLKKNQLGFVLFNINFKNKNCLWFVSHTFLL